MDTFLSEGLSVASLIEETTLIIVAFRVVGKTSVIASSTLINLEI